jgi:F-type H+-transporting ATP synthase subunit e
LSGCGSLTPPKVLRYSALFIGIFYGFYHQSTLTAQSEIAKIDREYERKANLIAQAKAAWLQKTLPPEKMASDSMSLFIDDPHDLTKQKGMF